MSSDGPSAPVPHPRALGADRQPPPALAGRLPAGRLILPATASRSVHCRCSVALLPRCTAPRPLASPARPGLTSRNV
ncbi:unnamed protein product [Colias eurytheme]|nr:unnamed protein product [Colias eurytheme]